MSSLHSKHTYATAPPNDLGQDARTDSIDLPNSDQTEEDPWIDLQKVSSFARAEEVGVFSLQDVEVAFLDGTDQYFRMVLLNVAKVRWNGLMSHLPQLFILTCIYDHDFLPPFLICNYPEKA